MVWWCVWIWNELFESKFLKVIKHRFNLKTEKQVDVPSDVSAVSVNEILAPCVGPTRGLHGYMFPILYVQNQSPVRSGKNEFQS